MKKIFVTIMTICLIALVFSTTVFAEESTPDYVISVSALNNEGDLIALGSYTTHAEGWEAATDYARNRTYMETNNYDRIVVDLLADWIGTGKFHDGGEGFNHATIRFYDNTRITLNMNGHTINRGRTSYDYDGEVIFIADGADVIINGGTSGDPIIEPGQDPGDVKLGTITGGFSCNGGGGIHMQKANVTLNNVKLTGNTVRDDDGAAIAVHDGGHLTMNGGCLSNNHLTSYSYDSWAKCWGVLYTHDSTATLNKVVISENTSSVAEQEGLAVGMNGKSEVTLNDCIIENNGEAADKKFSLSLFHSVDNDCTLNLNNCEIKNNPIKYGVFYFKGRFNMNGGKITGHNTGESVIYVTKKTHATLENVTITDNAIPVLRFVGLNFVNKGSEIDFINCTFNNNALEGPHALCGSKYATVTITDCDLGNSTYVNKDRITFVDTGAPDGAPTGSIFGEGSLAVILSLIAVISSAVSICLTVVYNKKKAVPVIASIQEDNEEIEDEE